MHNKYKAETIIVNQDWLMPAETNQESSNMAFIIVTYKLQKSGKAKITQITS